MQGQIKYIGLYAICLGVLLLLIAFLVGWTDNNLVLLILLLLIGGGTIGHIILTKKQSKY